MSATLEQKITAEELDKIIYTYMEYECPHCSERKCELDCRGEFVKAFQKGEITFKEAIQ